MEFLDLFIVALMPILKTLIVTAIGLFLAIERVNLLGPVTRHHLNNLVFYVFTPALVASNLADTITSSNVVSLWFMPVNILLTFIIGSALGWILVKITRTPKHLHGLVIGCCSAGNLGNLLLIIIPAVCDESNSPFGDSSTCTTDGNAYASLSMAIGAVYIWTYVYNIIRASSGSKRSDSITPGETSESLAEVTEPLVSKDSQRPEDYEAQAESPPTGSEDKVPILKKIQQHMKDIAEKINLKMLFAPSTIATIVGLLVGVTTPVRKLMIGDSAPLRVIESSAALVGEATIPSMTLIVGANLLKGLKRSGIGLWLIIGVNVVRYIALPLCGILIVKGANHFGLVGSDALYQFVLLLQYALPSAMTIGTITQLFEVGESECSVIMLWNYAVASLFLTLWTAYYMWLVS
jgi:predicted permease